MIDYKLQPYEMTLFAYSRHWSRITDYRRSQ
jgi:hypothetical protein